MSTKSEFSVGLAAKLCARFCDAGGTPTELNTLAENQSILGSLLAVLRGKAVVAAHEYVIDCSTKPFIPTMLDRVAEDKHQMPGRITGQVTWDSSKVTLHLGVGQVHNKSIRGTELRKDLEGKPVLGAQVLDFLIDHPYLIPSSWKGKNIYFWGTIYRNGSERLCVRCLDWVDRDECWDHRYALLDGDWGLYSPAVLFAGS